MLKPEYLESLPDAYVGLYAQACEDILADMARKINSYDYYCSAAQWQKQKLKELGMIESEINTRLSQLTNRSVSTLNQMFSDASTEALKADDVIHAAAGKVVTSFAKSEALLKVLNAGARATQNTMKNLCGTTAHTATKQFEDALDRAWMQVSSGAFSYDAAVKTAIKDLCKAGVGYIKYPSGHTDTVEVAVRRAVVTGINQTACQLQLARADEMGCTLVETTAHAGARPSHVVWQGQVFSRDGDTSKYDDFESATGYGTGAGLGGWNCRHSFFPYYDGMARAYTPEILQQYEEKKYTYNGKKLTEYEASQQQRYIERQTRRWKRENVAMSAAGQDTGEAAAKVKQWQKTYNDFLNQTGLKRQNARTVISTANGVAKPLTNAGGTPIIEVQKTLITGEPNTITQETMKKGGINRNYYGADGKQTKQISNNGHGHQKEEAFGLHGEHTHDYVYDSQGKLQSRIPRELTETERKENADIL